jgi:hypothetical protein
MESARCAKRSHRSDAQRQESIIWKFIIFSGLPEMAMTPLKTPLHSVRTATVKHIMAILRRGEISCLNATGTNPSAQNNAELQARRPYARFRFACNSCNITRRNAAFSRD